MAKADKPMVAGTHGSYFPRPSYFGLKGKWWTQVEKLTTELANVRERRTRVGARVRELEQELRYQQDKLEEERVAAARLDKDEPDDTSLRKTEREIEKVRDKVQVLDKALDQVSRDLLELVREGTPEEVLEELRERGRKHEERYKQLVAEAMTERDQLGQVYGLHLWARGEDERGEKHHDRSLFRAAPLSPLPDGSAWYEHPLRWGDEEMADTAITVVRQS
jgi:chromosome segregation ATPase